MSMSALTLATVSCGTGGPALLTWDLPSRASTPAMASRATPTSSADSHAGMTAASAMMAAASRAPTP